ncbi:enoyl-CoA hydratase/isomerase family protein [Desulfosediminicola sp.]|uniref:enoyl-CoA hydratase/isomerase family protein n=1 Tax=Desulfosediminicola sp. TaxID=2886825 RepID=UPI003AF252EF
MPQQQGYTDISVEHENRVARSTISRPDTLNTTVEGVTVEIDTTSLFHCDRAVVSSTSRFRVQFANPGVGPAGASSVRPPLLTRHNHAREVLRTGRFFTADEARSWVLINQITDHDCTNEGAMKQSGTVQIRHSADEVIL